MLLIIALAIAALVVPLACAYVVVERLARRRGRRAQCIQRRSK
jgi:hypothetical protein